jgi:hypothetical protein
VSHAGAIVTDNTVVPVTAGTFLSDADEIAELVVGVFAGKPVYLDDVAEIRSGPDQPEQFVWFGTGAGAEEILIPEEDLGLDRLLNSLEHSRRSGKSSSIVVVAEGDKSGKNVYELASYVEKNLPQYEVRVSVLGHMQRGGSPSCFDRVLASRMGVKAVELLLDGKSNLMVGISNNKMVNIELANAIKEHHSINKEILRISEILTT